MTQDDLEHLRRCVELATIATDAGDSPFGSVLVSGAGEVLFEDRNRTGQGADDASIYRYDRPALIEAIATRVARQGVS